LSEIVKKARVSKYSVYGSGRLGPVVSEIERSGLIEARIFPGERGRGGRILKLRVLYENEKVKQQLGCRALRAREK